MSEKITKSQTSKATTPWRKLRLLVASLFLIVLGAGLVVGPWYAIYSLTSSHSTQAIMTAGAISFFAIYISTAGLALVLPGFMLLVKVLRGRLPLTLLERLQIRNPSLEVPEKVQPKVWRATALIALIGSLVTIALTVIPLLQIASVLFELTIGYFAGPILLASWIFISALISLSGSTNSYLALNRALKIVGILSALTLLSLVGGIVSDADGFVNSVSESSGGLTSWLVLLVAPLTSVLGWLTAQKWMRGWVSSLPARA